MATALGALLLTLTLLFFNLNLARGSSRAPLDVDIDVKYPKPTALGDGATRPLCVTVARNVSVSVSEPAQTGTRFIVVYGEVERVVTTLGGESRDEMSHCDVWTEIVCPMLMLMMSE